MYRRRHQKQRTREQNDEKLRGLVLATSTSAAMFESVQVYLAGSALVCQAVQSVFSFFTLSPLAWLLTLFGKHCYLSESLTHTTRQNTAENNY